LGKKCQFFYTTHASINIFTKYVSLIILKKTASFNVTATKTLKNKTFIVVLYEEANKEHTS
jgi:hypothetical protein